MESRAATVAVLALGLLSLIGGWVIVLGSGFHSRINRYPASYVFVDGPGAFLMATLQFCVAAIALVWLLQSRMGIVRASILSCCLIFCRRWCFPFLSSHKINAVRRFSSHAHKNTVLLLPIRLGMKYHHILMILRVL